MPQHYNYFNLTLDTNQPGSYVTVNRPTNGSTANAAFVTGNSTGKVVITDDDLDAIGIKVWIDSNSSSSIPNDSTQAWAPLPAAATINNVSTKEYTYTFSSSGKVDGTYYVHAALIDSVGNISPVISSSAFELDTTPPSLTVQFTDKVDNTEHYRMSDSTFTASISSSDTNGVSYITITATGLQGDSNTNVITLTNPNSTETFDITFDSSISGVTQIVVVAYDQAGNSTSSASMSSSTVFIDPGIGALSLEVRHVDSTTTALGPTSYINLKNGGSSEINTFYLLLSSSDTDIVGYKVWEAGQSEPVNYTTYSGNGAFSQAISNFALQETSGAVAEGSKTINAKVVDPSNHDTSTSITFNVDKTGPVVSISASPAAISGTSPHDSTTLTISAVDAMSAIKNYSVDVVSPSANITRNLTEGTYAAPATLPATVTLGYADLGSPQADGSFTVRISATDIAGNTSTQDCTVYYDTTAPVVAFNPLATIYPKNDFTFSVTVTEAHACDWLKWWVSSTQNDRDLTNQTITTLTNPNISNIPAQTVVLGSEGAYYIHVAVCDEAGNIGYADQLYIYDITAPTGTINIVPTVTNSTEVAVTITASDNVFQDSELQMKIVGDTTDTQTWRTFSSPINVNLDTTSGIKTLRLLLKDPAGNEIANDLSAPSDTVELDRVSPDGTLNFFAIATGSANGTAIPSGSTKFNNFFIRVRAYDDEGISTNGNVQYQIYGDVCEGAAAASGKAFSESNYITFNPTSPNDYMQEDNLWFTTGEGNKTIYLKLKDNAGNEGLVQYDFTYDITNPTVDIISSDGYGVVSCSEVKRVVILNNEVTRSQDDANIITFTFRPSEYIQAFKVCAYEDTQTAAGNLVDPATAVAIPITNGSENTSASSLNTISDQTVIIDGRDYRAALGWDGETSVDGLHVIVVYVQDLAGQWSSLIDLPYVG